LKKFAAAVAVLMLLTGCSGGSKEMQRGLDLRAELLKASECRFSCEITVDYSDKIYTFSMDCRCDSRGDLTFAVTAPETIAGITGNVSDAGGKLTFDDTALQFDLMAEDQVTPVSAPWILMKTLRSGYITSAGMDGGRLRLTVDDSYEDDALHLDIWLGEDNRPENAEILYKERRILSLKVINFETV